MIDSTGFPDRLTLGDTWTTVASVMENREPNGLEHPRGTLAIVLIYALLFALGWLLLYYGEFLPRG